MNPCAIFISLVLGMTGPAFAADADDATLERLGKLSGEVLLHAGVLKRLDARCPSGRPTVDHAAALERDSKPLPENVQSMIAMQTGAALQVADFIARDIVSKAQGCHSEAFGKAYAQTEDALQKALRAWRQGGRP